MSTARVTAPPRVFTASLLHTPSGSNVNVVVSIPVSLRAHKKSANAGDDFVAAGQAKVDSVRFAQLVAPNISQGQAELFDVPAQRQEGLTVGLLRRYPGIDAVDTELLNEDKIGVRWLRRNANRQFDLFVSHAIRL